MKKYKGKIVIVGGKLQGSEAAYLGREAMFYVTLIDMDPNAPVQNLVDRFICGDVLQDAGEIRDALDAADMILPTLENDYVLEGLVRISKERGYALAFDMNAYIVTVDKFKSDKLFLENKIPCPQYYPLGKLPYIAKPNAQSGSHGVRYLDTLEELNAFVNQKPDNYIVQEYVTGPSFSAEIIGEPGNYRVYEITEIFVDDIFDCYLAAAYRTVDDSIRQEIEKNIIRIAELLKLKGIMDIEIIVCDDGIKVLEIDARLPSQTAIAVYKATGMNYISELFDIFCNGGFVKPMTDLKLLGSYMNCNFVNGEVHYEGEHIMTQGGILNYDHELCETSELISDYVPGSKNWRGIFINDGLNYDDIKAKEKLMIEEVYSNIK